MATATTYPHLDSQISALRAPGEWVNFHGLVSCALKHLPTQATQPDGQDTTNCPPPPPSEPVQCTSINLLGSGTYDYVYRLSFSSGQQLAASIPKADEEMFYAPARLSEIATMKFVAESGLYPDVPVPQIYAYEVRFDNEAGAPWTLMELLEGIEVNNDHAEGCGVGVTGFDVLPEERQMAIVKALAKLQVHLSKPVPFKKIGSIYFGNAHGYKVGPLTSFSQKSDYCSMLGGPHASIADMYMSLLQAKMAHALRAYTSLPTDSLTEPESSWPLQLTPRSFSDIYHMLTSLIPHFGIPPSTSTLVLHHSDIALRNVLFDEASLKEGCTPKITGVLDWAGAQVLPLMLTAKYPGDLMSNTTTPFKPTFFEKEPRPDTHWNTVPFDWTSTGPREEWPGSWDGRDHGPSISNQVRRYYLRTYFSACYASQMAEVYGDMDLSRASLYQEAGYYLKFHEVMCSGVGDWERFEGWIKETYWRLRITGEGGKHGKGYGLGPVVGPNVYHGNVERPVRDLRLLEAEQEKWAEDIGSEANEENEGEDGGDSEDAEEDDEDTSIEK